jgi:arylsulfatase A-like enzyme
LCANEESNLKKSSVLFLISTLSALPALSATPQQTKAPAPMNVILVVMDTTRADAISAYRSDKRKITPNIDQLAQTGVVFSNAFANAPQTTPSHMSILTGVLPTTHHVGASNDPNNILSERIKTLAELLKTAGYKSLMSADFRSVLNPYVGFGRGFDSIKILEIAQKTPLNYLLKQKDPEQKQILKWIAKNKTHPFFLFLHTWRPHSPYLSEEPENRNFLPKKYQGHLTATEPEFWKSFFLAEFDVNFLSPMDPEFKKNKIFSTSLWHDLFFTDRFTRAFFSPLRTGDGLLEDRDFLRGAYEGAINYFDDRLGDFFHELKRKNLFKNTLIIITADHGEEFLEHGNFFHQTSFNENLHIPLLMVGPTIPAIKVNHIVQSVDIVPTVLDVIGVQSNQFFDGKSLRATWEKQDEASNTDEVYSYLPQGGVATVQNLRWKIIYYENAQKTEIYDLLHDPGEKSPVKDGGGDSEQIKAMKRHLSAKIGKIVPE